MFMTTTHIETLLAQGYQRLHDYKNHGISKSHPSRLVPHFKLIASKYHKGETLMPLEVEFLTRFVEDYHELVDYAYFNGEFILVKSHTHRNINLLENT